MTSRLLGSAALAAVGAALLVSGMPARLDAQSSEPVVRGHEREARPFSPPRTPDGHPDMQGYWTNGTYTPLERPTEFGTKEFFTREEALAYAKRRDDQLRAQPRDNIHYDDAIWQGEREVKGLTSLRTSLIYDPPDGKIPTMTAEGQKRADARAAARKLLGPADNAQMRTLGERCIMWPHEGPPMLPAGYFPNLQIVQGPGQFVVMQEIIHNARVIPTEGRPKLGQAIRNYRGESRGRWEGDTLVVETTNFTEATQFRGSSAALKVTERFTMINRDSIQYRFTVEDPTTWATSWSAEIPMVRTEDPIYEYACHEGNYGLPNILRAQRVADAAARK